MPPHQAQGEARRAQIMAFIRAYYAEHGMSPSLVEISEGVGLSSPTAARNHVLQLEAQGKLKVRPGIARAIVLLD